jgi:phosphoglycolate phosphatase-like HAD superfamily hydrolase
MKSYLSGAIRVVNRPSYSLESFPMKHVIFDCDGTLMDTSSPKYMLFPGIKELLLTHSKNCLFYVWTARGRVSTIKFLEEFGVKSLFDSFSTPDDAIPKPHIDGLIKLVGKTPKQSICVIGDSSNDMIGAKNFGVLAIGATWNKEAHPQILRDSGADFIVSHPSECSKLIELNLKGDTHV